MLLFSLIDYEASGKSPMVLMLALACILLGGLLSSKLTKLLHVPNVTGYLLTGLLLGPGLFGLIPGFDGIIAMNTVDALKIIVKIELAFIAFTIGCEFKTSFLKSVGAKPIALAFGESFFAVVVITGVTMCFSPIMVKYLNKSYLEIFTYCLALGAIGAATAPAATLMVIKQYRAKGDMTNTLVATVAVDDATALIFFGISIAVIEILSPGQGNSNLALSIALPFIVIILAVIIGIAFGFGLVLLVRYFHGRGTRLCSILAMVLGAAGACWALNTAFNTLFANHGLAGNNMNISDLFAVMALGVVYTNFSPEEPKTVELFDRFTPPFVMTFFILSGADLDFSTVTSDILIVLVISILCYVIGRSLGKYVGVLLVGNLTRLPKKITNLMSLGLMPQGGVALGLALIASQLPVLNSFSNLISMTIITACFLTELFGPLFTKYMLYKAGEADPALK